MLRRRRLQLIAILILGAFTFFVLFSRIFSPSPGRPPLGTPEVVLVTVIEDHGYSEDHIEQIKQNRIDYAQRHGW
jgi:mannan polymerase II complex MNN11 subunit